MCKSLMPTVLALDVQVALDVQKPDANSHGPGKGLGLVHEARTSVELSGPEVGVGYLLV